VLPPFGQNDGFFGLNILAVITFPDADTAVFQFNNFFGYFIQQVAVMADQDD